MTYIYFRNGLGSESYSRKDDKTAKYSYSCMLKYMYYRKNFVEKVRPINMALFIKIVCFDQLR